jgi:hypothetical protein
MKQFSVLRFLHREEPARVSLGVDIAYRYICGFTGGSGGGRERGTDCVPASLCCASSEALKPRLYTIHVHQQRYYVYVLLRFCGDEIPKSTCPRVWGQDSHSTYLAL